MSFSCSGVEAQGHEVVLFCPGPALRLRSSTTARGFAGLQLRLCFPFAQPRPLVSALAFPMVFFPVVLGQLLVDASRNGIQIINIHYPIDNFIYFALCRRLLPVHLVTSVHGGDAFDKGGRPRRRYSPALRFLLHASDLVVLPSDTYRRRLVEALPEIAARMTFIHNGVDTSRFCVTADEEDASGGRYVLCVAHLADYKGIDVLLRAFRVLLANEDIRLVLAGDGSLRGELEALAGTWGIRDRTVFLGTKTPSEVATLLRGCELLVLPSREESFGIVLIEAMASRKPVVASAVGGIREVIEHEISGILVEPENPEALAAAMRRVLTDGDLRKTIAANGYSRVVDSVSAHSGAAYLGAFASVVTGTGSERPRPSVEQSDNERNGKAAG